MDADDEGESQSKELCSQTLAKQLGNIQKSVDEQETKFKNLKKDCDEKLKTIKNDKEIKENYKKIFDGKPQKGKKKNQEDYATFGVQGQEQKQALVHNQQLRQ